MATLRDLWLEKDLTSRDVARQAGISVPTLYKMNRKEDVGLRSLKKVCRILGISLHEYEQLEVCQMAERYRDKT